jgi:transcriptional regulator with XRE-family HTH domain
LTCVVDPPAAVERAINKGSSERRQAARRGKQESRNGDLEIAMVAAARVRTDGEATRSRPQDVDRYVGARMRERRIMLGLTQQQMAELIGVTYQQAHKYEKGINRIAGGRLYQIAQALGVEVSYFYEGIERRSEDFKPTPQQRLLLELARNFTALPSRRHQEAICGLVRALVDPHVVEDDALALQLVEAEPDPEVA